MYATLEVFFPIFSIWYFQLRFSTRWNPKKIVNISRVIMIFGEIIYPCFVLTGGRGYYYSNQILNTGNPHRLSLRFNLCTQPSSHYTLHCCLWLPVTFCGPLHSPGPLQLHGLSWQISEIWTNSRTVAGLCIVVVVVSVSVVVVVIVDVVDSGVVFFC